MRVDSKIKGKYVLINTKYYDIIKKKFEHFTEWVWITKREVL